MQAKDKFIKEIEELIDSGQQDLARSKFLNFIKKRPRLDSNELYAFARLARWLRQYNHALKFLVRLEKKPFINKKAANSTALEYGLCLYRIGLTSEGISKLESVEGSSNYQKPFFLGLSYLCEINLQKAIENFKAVINNPKVRIEPLVQCEIELIGCYLIYADENNLSLAKEAIDRLKGKIDQRKYIRQYRITLYLECEYWIAKKKWNEFDKVIQDLETIEKKHEDYFLKTSTKKWKLLGAIAKNPAKKNDHLDEINNIIAYYFSLQNFEIVRFIKLYLAIYSKDWNALSKTYLLSTSPDLRQRIKNELPLHEFKKIKYPYEFIMEGKKHGDGGFFCVPSGKNSFSKKVFTNGEAKSKLMTALFLENDRPVTIGKIHDYLFNDIPYDIENSPAKIYQYIIRLRRWLKSNHIPLELTEKNGLYQIENTAEVKIIIETELTHSTQKKLEKSKVNDVELLLKNAFQGNWFSAKEASEELGISVRTAVRYLKKCLENKTLEVSIKKTSYRYRFIE